MDAQRIIQTSETINTALRVTASLKDSSRIRTSLNPSLLEKVIQTSIDCPEKPADYKLDFGVAQGSQLLDSICLTSGGADSTILWYKSGKPKGLYINVGQSYASREIIALDQMMVDYFYVDFVDSFNKSSFYDWKHIIPGRNFLFLTIAAEFVKDNGEIFFGVLNGEGYNSDKGDKSFKFLTEFEAWYAATTGKKINVRTMASDTKPGWLKWFKDQGYNLDIIRHQTVTCFSPLSGQKWQCGKCQSCLRKYLSFVNIGMNIQEDFEIHPMVGGQIYVKKYLNNLRTCLDTKDFSHYSQKRCIEDIEAIEVATEWLKKGGN